MPKLTQKGQVTIPKKIRQALGVTPGDEVEFRIAQDRCIVVEKSTTRSPFDRYVGYLSGKAGEDPDRIVASLRGEQDPKHGNSIA